MRFFRVAGFFLCLRKIDRLPWLMVKAELAFGGGNAMTGTQKEQIARLRGKGKSYALIAADLGISESTVKSHCRRNNLGANYTQPAISADACEYCGKPLKHTPGAKRRRFCSDKCRMAWWNTHPEAVNKKAVYHFKCAACGAPFESYGNAKRKYCSRACFGIAAWRVSDG